MVAPAKELLNVRDICHHVTHLVRGAMEPSIRVTLELSPQTGWLRGNAGEIDQAILNLILNAWDAMPEGGDLLISASNIDRETEGGIEKFVRIVIADNGAGIQPEIREYIFHPWFTTKPQGRGHGTGLPIVDHIVRGSGGEISFRSTVGQGSSFEILLPRVEDTDLTNAIAMPAAA
jgi:signal transduction histidine kinase